MHKYWWPPFQSCRDTSNIISRVRTEPVFPVFPVFSLFSCFPVFLSVILQQSCFYLIFVGKYQNWTFYQTFDLFWLGFFTPSEHFGQSRPMIFKNFLVDPNYVGVSYFFKTKYFIQQPAKTLIIPHNFALVKSWGKYKVKIFFFWRGC